MIPVRFYKSFSKRKNSTKQPAVSDAYDEINVVLKEDTTVETPSLVLTQTVGSASGNPVTVDASAGNMINPVVTFNPVQTGTGTPSLLNPRPIVPYTTINVDVNGNATVIDLQGNKYAGTLDITTGELTITWSTIVLNGTQGLSIRNWRPTADSVGWVYPYSMIYNEPISPLEVGNIIADTLESVTYASLYNGGVGISVYTSTSFSICIRTHDTTLTTDAAISAYLSQNPIEVCYKMATPVVIQLTPAQVALVTGSNTVSVNGDSTIAFNYVKGQIELDYVYAYIPEFGKYYFCSSPTILSNYHVQYDLVEDYLASRKTEIGSTVAHVLYSSTGYNVDIVDARMTVKANKAYLNKQNGTSGFSSSGSYVVGIISNQTNGRYGALNYYLMTDTQIENLVNALSDSSIKSQIEQFFTGDWLQLIPICIWIPIQWADALTLFCGGLLTLPETLKLGNVTMSVSGIDAQGYPISNIYADLTSVSLMIPYKWQDFRDNSPYTSASLYLPGVGDTDLNINDFYSSTNVSIATRIDASTGDIFYRIYNDDGIVLKTILFNGSVPVPLAHTTTSVSGSLAAVGGGIGGIASLGLSAVTGNVAGVVGSGIALMTAGSSMLLSANHRSTSLRGQQIGRSAFAVTDFILTIVALDTEDIDDASYIARIGRPVCVTHAISNHSGYVQCEEASVAIAGDNTERDIINNYLNTGFYYE